MAVAGAESISIHSNNSHQDLYGSIIKSAETNCLSYSIKRLKE